MKLIQGDCFPAMKEMPDNAFDLAIVDPPYNVGADDGKFGRGGSRAINPDYRDELRRYPNASEVPPKEYFDSLFRVSKNQIIWGANYYPEYLHHSGWIVWDKKKTSGLLSDAELAFQSFNKVVRIFRHTWEGFKKGAGSFEQFSTKTIHPNQKPVALYKWLLTNYAKPGQTILDTHLGSGSIAIACDDYGYDLTAYEIDKEYFEAATERIERHKAQGQLFQAVGL